MKILYVRAYEDGRAEVMRGDTRREYRPRHRTFDLLLKALESSYMLLFNGGRQWFPLKQRQAR